MRMGVSERAFLPRVGFPSVLGLAGEDEPSEINLKNLQKMSRLIIICVHAGVRSFHRQDILTDAKPDAYTP